MIKKKKIVTIITALSLVMGTASSAYGAENSSSQRISGEDRYKTAIQVSKTGWDKAETIILATGENFADALCAVPLAKLLDSPVILTPQGEITKEISDEILRLGAKKVLIMGGTGAVSLNVEQTVKESTKVQVERISGADRYETSTLIAKKLRDISKEKGKTIGDKVSIVYGWNFADAVSIASPAAVLGMPILLTDKDSIPNVISDFMKNNGYVKAYIVGGEGAVSAGVKESLTKLTNNETKRLSGKDRYETNIAVVKEFDKDLSYSNIYMATGGKTESEFADSLVGAALAAKNGSPLLLVGDSSSDMVKEYVSSKSDMVNKIVTLGGEGAVSKSVSNNVESSIKPKENNTKPVPLPDVKGGGSVSQPVSQGPMPSPVIPIDSYQNFLVGDNVTVNIDGKNLTVSYKLMENDLGMVVYGVQEGKSEMKFVSAYSLEKKEGNNLVHREAGLNSGKYTMTIVVSKRDEQKKEYKVNFQVK